MLPRYDGVLFDLLTALLDSWSLWERVAGDSVHGRQWRHRYLQRTYALGRYQPYERIVADAAADVGLPRSVARSLVRDWDDLAPWPEVPEVLQALAGCPLGVVTNCSETLAAQAVRRVAQPFTVVVSAEREGWYKPAPQPYRLALRELGMHATRVLFVAGSPSDVLGAAEVGMRVFWHNRLGLTHDAATTRALEMAATLDPLPSRVFDAPGGNTTGSAV